MRRPANLLALSFIGLVGAVSLTALAAPPAPGASSKPRVGASASASASGAPVTAANPGLASAMPMASGSASGAPMAGSAPMAVGSAVPPGTMAVEKPVMDGATYSVRLRDLEGRVDELKDQIRRSHTRLALLSDTILTGGAAGSRSEVVFHNEMSSAFRLARALFVIDGTVQYNKQDDTGALADQKEIPIFSGSIPPGDHTVQVILELPGEMATASSPT